jgi:ubiquinone/menaquinone biosynthesis C-methylase UbiE
MSPDDPQKAAQRQFARQASCYAVSRPHAIGTSLQVMVEWARPMAADRVLDVATGTGFTAFAFAETAGAVVATDITLTMLQQARRLATTRQLANIRFVQAAAESIPFRRGRFSLATCRIAPHHFASVPTFLHEMRRVLRPSGRLVITDSSSPEAPDLHEWHQELERLRDPSHVQNYTPSEWRRFIIEAGFRLEEFTTVHRSDLIFSDWVRTSGSPPEVVAELRRRFTEASAAVRDTFRIQEENGEFHFSWMLVILLARPAP